MEYILPLSSSSISSTSKASDVDEVAWTDRLLQTMKYLEEKAINAILTLTGLKYMCVHDPLFQLTFSYVLLLI
jgi:sister chromatid cohesion protein PDS5